MIALEEETPFSTRKLVLFSCLRVVEIVGGGVIVLRFFTHFLVIYSFLFITFLFAL
jgi:hypothetical protein